MRILVVEDEKRIADFLTRGLQGAGYAVDAAPNGATALEFIHATDYDLVILDIMLPDVDGLKILEKIRNRKLGPPVLILSARGAVDDRVKGLELGADDYLVKPFSPREVVSRVKAILRRTALYVPTPADGHENGAGTYDKGKKVDTGEELHFRDLYINVPARRVEVGGQDVPLTAKEFDLLVTLASSPDRVFTRESLLDQIWGYTYLGDGRTVDVHVGTLRKKIEVATGSEVAHMIKTVWGVGYKFVPEG